MANGIYSPGVSVNVQNPATVIAGVQTNLAGVAGTSGWGPTNQAVAIGNGAFGSAQARKHDLSTLAAEAALQGATNLLAVRVTDGTDTAATGSLGGPVATALYTGSEGNLISVATVPGGRANTVTLTISKSGAATEVFPNLAPTAVANAVNFGAGVPRGPSAYARLSNATTVTANAAVTLSGGSDGAGANSVQLAAALNAFGKSGVQFAAIADLDDPATYSTQAAWGEQNACLVILTSPAGQTVSAGVAGAHSGGVDSINAVLLHGDWPTIEDATAGARKVSPQGFYLGKRAALGPHQSVLNKPLSGIVSTERTAAGAPYSDTELDQLSSAGLEVISQGLLRGGNAYGALTGVNTSSNPATASDAHSTMTNFLRASFKGSMGQFIGEPNGAETQRAAAASISHFLAGLVSQGILALNADGSQPFKVKCDASNNPTDRSGLGFLRADVLVTYQGIVRQFDINLQGGATVSVNDSIIPSTL